MLVGVTKLKNDDGFFDEYVMLAGCDFVMST